MSRYMKDLIRLSNEYGADTRYVVKGGGNTSLKDGNTMFVKASGYPLSTIKENGFVKMDLSKLASMWLKEYPVDESEREEVVLQDLMDARETGETLRPSVEALLHSLIPFRFVVHLHPAIVNGLTCSVSGKDGAKQYFHDALWIDIVNPGFILAKKVKEKMEEYEKEHETAPKVIFLQNHGLFVASDSASGIDEIYEHIMKTLEHALIRKPNFSSVKVDDKEVLLAKELIQKTQQEESNWLFLVNHELLSYLKDKESFYPISSSYTPDHIVYSSVAPLYVSKKIYKSDDAVNSLQHELEEYLERHKVYPKVIAFQNLGVFCKDESARTLFVDTIKVAVFSESFGGPVFMEDEYINFIRDWEVENYRAKISS